MLLKTKTNKKSVQGLVEYHVCVFIYIEMRV